MEGGDIQANLSKYSKYIPNLMKTNYGELHLPGKNYCGPLTRLDIRLDENNEPVSEEHEPVDRIDEACYKHDIAYTSADIRCRCKSYS